MTHAVIYNRALQPLTILNVPPWAWDMLHHGMDVQVPLPSDPSFLSVTTSAPDPEPWRVITVRSERFVFRGQRTLILWTPDEKDIPKLPPEFLPVQQSALGAMKQESYEKGYSAGFMDKWHRNHSRSNH